MELVPRHTLHKADVVHANSLEKDDCGSLTTVVGINSAISGQSPLLVGGVNDPSNDETSSGMSDCCVMALIKTQESVCI